MFEIVYQVPLLAIGIPAVLALVRYLMMYIGFRIMLGRARPSDYPEVYRTYIRGLSQRGTRVADVIKIIRTGHDPRVRTPDLWVEREVRPRPEPFASSTPRRDRTPAGR